MQSFIFWYKDQTGHVNQAGETVTSSLPHKLSHSQSCYAYIGTYIYIYSSPHEESRPLDGNQ